MKYKFLEKLGLVFLSVNVKTVDGQPLFISDLSTGGVVEVVIDGEKQPLPDGSWDLENGKTIIVKDGNIQDVTDTVPVEDVPADQTNTVVEGDQPTENVTEENPTEQAPEAPSDETPTEDATATPAMDMPAEEVVAAVTDVVDTAVSDVVDSTDSTPDEVKTLKEKVTELQAKLDELQAKLDDKEKSLNMANEKLENTIGTKKTATLNTSNVSEADKNKFWYKKLHGLV